MSIAAPGQEILERSSVLVLSDDCALVTGDGSAAPPADETGPHGDGPDAGPAGRTTEAPAPAALEIRARLALPARGRSIQGREAARIVSLDLPRALERALDLTGERADRLRAHVAALEDHRALTRVVETDGWVAFLADGSVLPRRSGVSDDPLDGGVPLQAPESMAAIQVPRSVKSVNMTAPASIGPPSP